MSPAPESPSPAPPGSTSNRTRADVWHRSAPAAVRRAFRSGDASKGWAAWAGYLAERSRPVPLARLLPGKTSPLSWAGPEGNLDSGVAVGVAEIERLGTATAPKGVSPEATVRRWLAGPAAGSDDPRGAAEALAWCHCLPPLTASVKADVWWDLLDHLTALAVDAAGISLEDKPLAHQMLAGELPLTLGYLLPEITPCRKLLRGARQALSTGLIDLSDGEGLLHGRYLGLTRPLLACWTRCRAMGSKLAKGCWSREADTQYEWLVRHALRLTRADGTHVFSANGEGPPGDPVSAPSYAGAWCKAMFSAALKLVGNEEDRDIATVALPGHKRAEVRRVSRLALPESANHSEWAATTVLRPGWVRNDPRLTVVWPGRTVRMELETNGEVVFSGVWGLELYVDGRAVEPTDDWEEVCWESDDDVDYLELENEFSGGLRVQRHMVLAREDAFLLLADAVLDAYGEAIEYRGSLPLRPGIAFQGADETREGYLVGEKRRALVLPPALPEWRIDPRGGTLGHSVRGLELRRSVTGRALFAPLFLDLCPSRMGRACTWRQLTVAEDRRIVGDDTAVGYRVMVGKEQWLIYRSLAKKGNRTLLGHNTVSELVVARFDREGEVEGMLEVE